MSDLFSGDQRVKVYVSVTDANVRKYLQRAEEKLSRDLQKEKAMYRGMFSSNQNDRSEGGINQTRRAGDGV